jgi:hypothetical protein
LINFLEKKAEDPKINGNETVKQCKVAVNIVLVLLKLEDKSINAVKQRFSNNSTSKVKFS